MRLTIAAICVCLFNGIAGGATAADLQRSQPFAVERAIESARVLTLSGRTFPESSTPATDQYALFSPDGSRFIVRTRRGEIDRDVNIDTLLLWKRAEIDRALQSGAALPSPIEWYVHAFHDDGGGLESLKWESAKTLSFLAQAERGVVQAFVIDTDSKRVTQLTQSQTDVVGFATSRHQTLYYAREWAAVGPTVVNATDSSLYELYNLDARKSQAVVLYKQTRGTTKTQQLSVGAYTTAEPKIWISPDERYAITLAPEVNPPAAWSRYQVRTRGYTEIGVRDPKSTENAQRLRYIVIDLGTGASRPLLDAPAGLLANNGTPLEVFWPKGGKSVIVSNTYLPLTDSEPSAILQPVIAEVSLQTGKPMAIATEPVVKPGQNVQGRVVAVSYDVVSNELLVTRKTGEAFSREVHRREASSWKLASTGATPNSPGEQLRVWLRQNENERPKLYVARDRHQERELHDPNPEFEHVALGRQETFTFEFQGKQRAAAVIYPVGYREGERYPFILQTHGLGQGEYVLEGPKGSTTSYAAQTLASAGFVIAQLPDIRVDGYNTAQEGPDNADYWRTAIDTLSARGLIDKEKIGVIAWSRTGYHLLAALARYPQLFKAASVSDAIQYGSYLQVLATPARGDRIRSHAEMTSGKVFERGMTQWIEDRNAFYGSLQSRTPLRIESIGTPVPMWETFAVRRMQGLPVEHVYYPNGSHTLMKPSERLASQGGSVDWFRFWLQGYEDPAPGKSEQYKRWRALRDADAAAAGTPGLQSSL